MNNALIDEFENPSCEYRGKPFWAWNGKLDPEELQRQIRLMNTMGLGGFFMHSRVGLDTEYLSEDWFECVRACIEQADELDMEAWLYDEDRWPSGAAGGAVTRNPEYRMRFIVAELTSDPDEALRSEEDVIGVFRCRMDGEQLHDPERVSGGEMPALSDEQSLLIVRISHPNLHSWYNGYTYPDTLNPEAVRQFLEVTHEEYRKRVGEEFGDTVPGIFTDEPHCGGKFRAAGHVDVDDGLPWTGDLPEVFRERYGYELADHLPELFYDVNGREVTPARRDYHDCVTHMFCEAFARQIGEWCEQNDMLHTGHVLEEPTLSSQSSVVGSCMRFYEHMQAPGMDLLTEYNREYDTAKQVSSVARQFGRRWRLTETYGCTGWDFPFAGHKALGDWQAALGINLRCQHLSWYTMEGQAKRDYPASISYQSPWWEHYGLVEDYFARINAVMTRGKEVRDLLVVHPVESAWVQIKKGWNEGDQVERLDRTLRDLRDSLLAENIDFDYGDEDILSRHGMVSDGPAGPMFTVGEADYRAVLVPPMITMRDSTLRLLKEFKEAGGEVIFAGDAPEYIDAQPSEAASGFAEECTDCPPAGRALVDAVDPTCRRVSITDADGDEIVQTLHLLREDEDNWYLFVCNTGHDFREKDEDVPVAERTDGFDRVMIRLMIEAGGRPVELDPLTGERFGARAERLGDGWSIATFLPPIGSRLFVVPKKSSDETPSPRPRLEVQRSHTVNPPKWDVTLSDHNVLVLDRPAWRSGSGDWESPEEILRIDRKVREELGLSPRGGAMVQPWARERPDVEESVGVELSYGFEVEAVPSGPVFLGLERPGLYDIRVNGTDLSPDSECGWWTDRSLRKVPVDPALMREGENRIELACRYGHKHPGFEMVYLLGEFGVQIDGTQVRVVEQPEVLETGDWTEQGLPFFSGSVTYETRLERPVGDGDRIVVRLPGYGGVAARIFIDDRPAGMAAWPPDEVEITDYLKPQGGSKLGIEILGHRRNSHGPLHWTERRRRWTGSGSFLTDGDEWTDEYELVSCGLTEPPEILLKH